VEIGITIAPIPGRTAALARMAEELGFASVRVPDSQNLAPEVWGQLMLAAQATSTIELGSGVTNSLTRDVAVTASAALALQVESRGRAVCGIGRGDSAVQRIGKHEDRLASFERYVEALQAYLRGDSVERDGFASRLEWLPFVKVSKVPVEVTATGPKVIAAAARLADRVALAVGADPDHVRWALDTARAAAQAAGRDPATLRYGAYVNCVVHPERAVARDAMRGTAATFARFSAFAGSKLHRLPPPLERAASFLRTHYDMREHTMATAQHARALEDEFIDWFGIAGPPDVAVPRLQALRDVGLDFIHAVPGSGGIAREVALTSIQLLAKEVLPALGGSP
jgi:5,10-methylenetetrahydromethanopterin reductase